MKWNLRPRPLLPDPASSQIREGPSKLVITWDATIRLEVLPAEASAPGGVRLRTTYEKSTANVRSDTFDPAAAATQEQYQKLEGKVVEFTLDASGKVISVSGLAEIVDGEKAVQAAREWIAQLDAGSGAPAGGVTVGQNWSSEQPAESLPVAGMVWRTESEYLRNEVCHPPNPEGAPAPSNAESSGSPESGETCAVILTHLNLVRPKPVRDPTPEEYRKNGMQTAGKWNGSAQSLSYISLRTGLVVSVTQTGTEEMDVTLTTATQRFPALCRHDSFTLSGCAGRGRCAREIIRRNRVVDKFPKDDLTEGGQCINTPRACLETSSRGQCWAVAAVGAGAGIVLAPLK